MCTTQYSVQSVTIRSVFQKHWHILKSDPELASVFKDPPLFVNKRGRNIRDHLVHANYGDTRKSSQAIHTRLHPLPNVNYRCGSCVQCNNTMKTSHFSHPHTG